MSSSTSHPTLLALIPVSSLVGADLHHLWPFLACWDLPLVLISLCPAAAGPWGISECLSIHAVLKLIPGCVCHRAVHSDRADGSNSDDGGYRRGRPCVPGTGSGMMAGEGLSPVVSTLGSLCLLAANGDWSWRWWVERDPLSDSVPRPGKAHLILRARECTVTCQEERLVVGNGTNISGNNRAGEETPAS